jgi:hypothetical protein
LPRLETPGGPADSAESESECSNAHRVAGEKKRDSDFKSPGPKSESRIAPF